MNNLKPHILSLIALVIFGFLAAGSDQPGRSGGSRPAISSAASPELKPNLATDAEPQRLAPKPSSPEGLRLRFAEVLKKIY